MRAKKILSTITIPIGWKWAENTDTGIGILQGKNWMLRRATENTKKKKKKNGARTRSQKRDNLKTTSKGQVTSDKPL